MKLVINEKFINIRKKLAQFTTLASLGILVVGLIFAFRPNDPRSAIYSYVALIVGFVLSQIGMYFTSRFGRNPRIDQVLTKSFENLRHEYTFFVYTSPLPLVLTGPCGIWLLMPLTATGLISNTNGKWKQKGGNFLLKTIGQEGIGNPTREAEFNCADLKKYLATKGISDEEMPQIKPILVVLLKSTQLGDVSGSEVPVIDLSELKRYIRRVDRENCATPLDEEKRDRVNNALLKYAKNTVAITEDVKDESK
ncbi:MAG: hypothetical protein WBI14_10015 [Anaerolineaceae bacterium]